MFCLRWVLGLQGGLRLGEIGLHTLLGCGHVASKREALSCLLLAETVQARGDRACAAGKLIDLGFHILQLGCVCCGGLSGRAAGNVRSIRGSGR